MTNHNYLAVHMGPILSLIVKRQSDWIEGLVQVVPDTYSSALASPTQQVYRIVNCSTSVRSSR